MTQEQMQQWTPPEGWPTDPASRGLYTDVGLLPPWASLPQDFRRLEGPWVEVAKLWLSRGIDSASLRARPGVNRKHAIGHLAVAAQSFVPSHEHRLAGVAYLLSLWFEIVDHRASHGARKKAKKARGA